MQEMQLWSLGQEDPLEEEMATQSFILAWDFHGQRSLADYSPWGHKELDMPEATEHPRTGRKGNMLSLSFKKFVLVF